MLSDPNVLRQLLDTSEEGAWFIGLDGRTRDVNMAMCRILGRPRDRIIGRSVFEFVDAENRAILERELAASRAGKPEGPCEIALSRPDGRQVHCINSASSVQDNEGNKLGSIGLWTDISRLKAVETELRRARTELESEVAARTAELARSEARLRESQRIARLGSWETDGADGLWWSEQVSEIFGLEPGAFDGRSETFYELVHPEDRDRVRAASAYALQHLEDYEDTHRILRPTGEIRTVHENAHILRDSDGRVTCMIGTVQDITEQVEREQKLNRAQRLEAVGQLTGGIAHDFNNLLAVVMSCAELLEATSEADPQLVLEILKATQRGADLTHRLLAFSRQQKLMPGPVDLGALIGGMTPLLTRTLGETVDVVTGGDAACWKAHADPAMLENAILNLGINARDAMPSGGRLSISCANITLTEADVATETEFRPGDYVVISVVDTGTGMSDEVLSQAFQPFYTTKPVGQGSGLGLSMVYGFAKQSGGHVSLDSRVGHGTTARIYLPRSPDPRGDALEILAQSVPSGRGETILVVEDNAAVRRITVRMLESLGYATVEAEEAVAARQLLDAGLRADLVLSDVVLPGGTSGADFEHELSMTWPGLTVILMSGHAGDSLDRDRGDGPGEVHLKKPFTRAELARTVRAALDQGGAGETF